MATAVIARPFTDDAVVSAGRHGNEIFTKLVDLAGGRAAGAVAFSISVK